MFVTRLPPVPTPTLFQPPVKLTPVPTPALTAYAPLGSNLTRAFRARLSWSWLLVMRPADVSTLRYRAITDVVWRSNHRWIFDVASDGGGGAGTGLFGACATISFSLSLLCSVPPVCARAVDVAPPSIASTSAAYTPSLTFLIPRPSTSGRWG